MKNGKLSIYVDIKTSTQSVMRLHYMLQMLEDIGHKLAGSKIYSALDAASGLWQIPLAEDSQLFTTFITPFGRFAFKSMPFRITSGPKFFQRDMVEWLKEHAGVEIIMDYILMHGRDLQEHD